MMISILITLMLAVPLIVFFRFSEGKQRPTGGWFGLRLFRTFSRLRNMALLALVMGMMAVFSSYYGNMIYFLIMTLIWVAVFPSIMYFGTKSGLKFIKSADSEKQRYKNSSIVVISFIIGLIVFVQMYDYYAFGIAHEVNNGPQVTTGVVTGTSERYRKKKTTYWVIVNQHRYQISKSWYLELETGDTISYVPFLNRQKAIPSSMINPFIWEVILLSFAAIPLIIVMTCVGLGYGLMVRALRKRLRRVGEIPLNDSSSGR